VGPGEGPDPRDDSVRNAIDIIDEAMGEPVLTDPQKDAIRPLCRERTLLWPCATDFPPGSATWARWGCGSAHAVLLRASSIVLQCCCRSWGVGPTQSLEHGHRPFCVSQNSSKRPILAWRPSSPMRARPQSHPPCTCWWARHPVAPSGLHDWHAFLSVDMLARLGVQPCAHTQPRAIGQHVCWGGGSPSTHTHTQPTHTVGCSHPPPTPAR
jgi:hypothetical protein